MAKWMCRKDNKIHQKRKEKIYKIERYLIFTVTGTREDKECSIILLGHLADSITPSQNYFLDCIF